MTGPQWPASWVHLTPRWPGAALVRDELDQMPRRRAFAEAHPGAEFDSVGAFYVGFVPYTEGDEERSITIRANSWGAVLDALEEHFSDGEQDTG